MVEIETKKSKGALRLIPTFLAILISLFTARAESAVFHNYWIAFEQSTVTNPDRKDPNVRVIYDLRLQVEYTADNGQEIWTQSLFFGDLGKDFTYLIYRPIQLLPGGRVLKWGEHFLQGHTFCRDFTSTKGVTLDDPPTDCYGKDAIGPSPYEADRQKTLVFHPVPYDLKWYIRD